MASNILILALSDYQLWTDISKNTPQSKYDYATRGGQRKYLKPILGADLYDKVIIEVEAGPSEPYLTLINEYIKPYLVVKCYREILADSGAIHSATGPKSITDNGNNQTEVQGAQLGTRLRHLDNDSNLFKNELIDYLEDNEAIFPEYESNCNTAKINRPNFGQIKRTYEDKPPFHYTKNRYYN